VDAFGSRADLELDYSLLPDIELEVIQNPESFFSKDSSSEDELIAVADSAFPKKDVPSPEDTRDHLLPVETVITASFGDQLIGFESVDTYAGTSYSAGTAVKDSFQGEGIGSVLIARGILEHMEEEEGMFTGRTQNPAAYSMCKELFNVFPEPKQETPGELETYSDQVASVLDPSKEFDEQVMRQAYGYGGGMYPEMPEGDYKEYFEELIEFDRGDAVLMSAEITKEDLKETYLEAVQSSPHSYRGVIR